MGKWDMVRLGDVCEILDHIRVPVTASERKKGIYPYYGANGIQEYVDDYIFDDELVLLAEDGGHFGSKEKPIAYRVSGKCWVNNHAHVLKPKDMLNVDFLCYSIMFYDVSSLISGTTRAKLNQVAMRKMTIPLPPLAVQQKIADTLDRAAALIEKRKAQIAKLDLLVKSQFIKMFGDPITNPMGWESSHLSKHLRVIGGYAFSSKGFADKGMPVLRIGNINTGTFSDKNLVFWQHDKKLERYLLRPGDVVISLTGTVGKDDYANVCILGDDYEGYYLNQRNAKLELNVTINRHYLTNALRIPKIKGKLTGISRGIRQANVSNSDILNLELPIPPIELQNRFAAFIYAIEESKTEMQCGLTKLELLYKSLTQKFFKEDT